MRRIFALAAALAALAATTTIALADEGPSKLIRNGRKGVPGRAILAREGLAPNARAPSPALYQQPRALGTLAAARLGIAIPALRAAVGDGAVLVHDPGRGHVVRARGIAMPPLVPGEPWASAFEFVRVHAAAFGFPDEPREHWIGDEVEGPRGTRHYAVQQHAPDGVPIYGAVATVHVDGQGAPLALESEADPEPRTYRPLAPIDAATALLRAGRGAALARGGLRTARLVYFRPADDPAGGDAAHRLAWQVDIGADRTFVDAESGLVVERVDRRLYVDVPGNVYDSHSLTQPTGNPPAPASPNTTFEQKTLTDLDTSGFLRGTFCSVTDQVNAQAARAPVNQGTTYLFDPTVGTQIQQVEQTCIYYYVTETGKKVQALAPGAQIDFASLGQFLPLRSFVDISNDSNAFFDPSQRSLEFGQGNSANGIDNLERDLDVAAHEFGHFVEAEYAPDIAPRVNSPRRAMGEGFGDFLAATVSNGDAGRGGLPGASCIGDSTIPTGGGNFRCLREINPPVRKRVPQDVRGEEHDDGEIIGGSLWDLAGALNSAGGLNPGAVTSGSLDEAYRVLLAGLPFLPRSNAQFSDLVDALLAGEAARGNVFPRPQSISAAFLAHGIFPTSAAPGGPGGGQPKEILLGVPVDLSVGAGGVARFFVRVPTANATVLDVTTALLAGAGDCDLFVAPSNYNGVAAEIVSSLTNGTGAQAVTVNSAGAIGRDPAGATVNQADPKIIDDCFWLIDVKSNTVANYRLLARNADPAAIQPVNLGAFPTGGVGGGTIANPLQADLFFFDVPAGAITPQTIPIAGVTVQRTGGDLVPTVWLFDPDLNVLAADTDGAPVPATSTISGHPIERPGRYVIAVVPFTPEQADPTTTGTYTINLAAGTLPGTPIARPAPGTAVSVSGTIEDNEADVYTVTLAGTETRLDVVLRPSNSLSPGDIDLFMKPASSTLDQFEFISIEAFANETVEANLQTSPDVRASRIWFIVVFGFDVFPLRAGVSGFSQGYELDVGIDRVGSFGGGGGGGGCGFQPVGPGAGAGLALPALALALAALRWLRRR